MVRQETQDYYAGTADREVRVGLIEAIAPVSEKKIAIDCGCGAGKDIEYLRQQGFVVADASLF